MNSRCCTDLVPSATTYAQTYTWCSLGLVLFWFSAIRYHMGTIAFGSLLMAIVKVIRYIVRTAEKRSKAKSSAFRVGFITRYVCHPKRGMILKRLFFDIWTLRHMFKKGNRLYMYTLYDPKKVIFVIQLYGRLNIKKVFHELQAKPSACRVALLFSFRTMSFA